MSEELNVNEGIVEYENSKRKYLPMELSAGFDLYLMAVLRGEHPVRTDDPFKALSKIVLKDRGKPK